MSYATELAPRIWCILCVFKLSEVQFIKSLNECDDQQREKPENTLGTVLPEESWTQATVPKTLSGLVVRQCQDQYKASYVGSVLSSEDFFQKQAVKTQKPAKFIGSLFQYITSGHFKLFPKTIQQALDNEKFHGLEKNLAFEKGSAGPLSLPVRHAGAWLFAAPISALGFHMA